MMFIFAILLGIYSYLIFFVGLAGWLYSWVIILFTIAFWGLILGWGIRKGKIKIKSLKRKWYEMLKLIQYDKSVLLLGSLLAFQALVNFIGVLGPELGFDALWYHLTLPKLYLINHGIDFIPGGLLYYSAMPKLAEMFYTAGLAFGNENTLKFIHYSFGLLTCLALYKLGRKFFNPLISLIAVVIFYSNLVVGWESTSTYIDLVRAFFEVMALWGVVNWFEKRTEKWLILSALMVGLAITTKLLAIGSLGIFVALLILRGVRGVKGITRVVKYIIVALLVPLPWFIFSYLHTGNPVFPFFTDLYKVAPEPLSVFGFVEDVWILFTQASDPISLVYVLFIAAAISHQVIKSSFGKAQDKSSYKVVKGVIFLNLKSYILHPIGVIALYSFLAIIIWYFTPRSGGGRFILPYLPAFSLLCAGFIHYVWKDLHLRRILLTVVICASLFSIVYRAGANSKYLPVIVGKETKAQFLADHLNFAYGDFYDTDGYFADHIKPTDRVLLYRFHNLYYVDFPFIDASWLRLEDRFNYIAVQNGWLPEKYKEWKLVYKNDKTMVKLYRREGLGDRL